MKRGTRVNNSSLAECFNLTPMSDSRVDFSVNWWNIGETRRHFSSWKFWNRTAAATEIYESLTRF